MKRTFLKPVLAASLALAGAQTSAQDAYVLGLTGAITGPAAATYAAAIEGMRLYVEGLNARGGVNGKPVRLIVQDDQGEPSRATANAKRLLAQDKVLILILASPSSTYAPITAEVKRAQVPLLYSGAICPKDVYPPADEYQYCTTAFGSFYESHAALGFIKKNSREAVKLGTAAMAIPLSRGEMDYAESISKSFDMTVVDKQVIPPTAPDYLPFATKLKDAGPNWVYSAAPWVTQVRTFEALRRLGWGGRYITIAHVQSEDELPRLKDNGFYVFGANALFQDNLPAHREIRDAAGRARINMPVNQMTEGWIAGMVLEQVLKKTSWPPTPAKTLAAMSNIKVDMKGLRGGPLEWTKDNHFRTRQYYRVWNWDPAKQSIALVQDWQGIEVKK